MKKRIAARLGASAHAAQARDALQARAAAARARPGSQQASGESQRKRGLERRRGLAHSGQRPRFAQKGRQRGGPRPGKARRWRATSTGGRHAGAVSTRTRRAALARASAPAGAGGAGSSSCMKTHHGQPAGADWASGWKGAPSWASPATATHSMPCAVHSSTRSPAAAFSRAGCAAAQSTSSAAASAQKRRAETGRRHSTPGRENARTVKKSPENCNKTWKKVAQCRGMRAKNPASASCLQAARVRRLEPVQRLAVRGLHEPRAPAGRSQGSRAPKPALLVLFVLFTPAAQLARRHLKTPPRAAGAACNFLDSR